MKICILFPGKIKPKVLAGAQDEYVKRLRVLGVEFLEYKDEKIASRSAEQVKEIEAERIFKVVKADDYLVACDERGKKIQTLELADKIRAAQQGGVPMVGKRRLVIVVGGALGLAESVRKKAKETWSLSSLVMAGGVARIVLLEGVYRAFSIVNKHPYHNE